MVVQLNNEGDDLLRKNNIQVQNVQVLQDNEGDLKIWSKIFLLKIQFTRDKTPEVLYRHG